MSKVSTRIQQKRGTAADWQAATNMVPMSGEIIVYNSEAGAHLAPRIKIGDGNTVVDKLPFLTPASMINFGNNAFSAGEGVVLSKERIVIGEEGSTTTLKPVSPSLLTTCGAVTAGANTRKIKVKFKKNLLDSDYIKLKTLLESFDPTKKQFNGFVVQFNTTSGPQYLPIKHISALVEENLEDDFINYKESYTTELTLFDGFNVTEAIPDNHPVTEIFMGVALGEFSTAFNNKTLALGKDSHTEGNMSRTTATGVAGHAEGYLTSSEGVGAHAEGSGSTASGSAAHAEGSNTLASGQTAHAEGNNTTASGNNAHSEGSNTQATATSAHAEGYNTTASGTSSHTEGSNTVASNSNAHAEGYHTQATHPAAHAEGNVTKAFGNDAHSEGNQTKAHADSAHAEGYATKALGVASHAEGFGENIANGDGAHAEGYHTQALAKGAHAEGIGTVASGEGSHATGLNSKATGLYSFARGNACEANAGNSTAEGYRNKVDAAGNGAHAEGHQTIAKGAYSHSEGANTHSNGQHSHTEGYNTETLGSHSHAEGVGTLTAVYAAHSEGQYTKAYGMVSHAEGQRTITGIKTTDESGNVTYSGGEGAHAEGRDTVASGHVSHAEGVGTTASGEGAHAEGRDTVASGDGAHAEGVGTTASGHVSHAEGVGTIAAYIAQKVSGTYNENKPDTLYEIGNGYTSEHEANSEGNLVPVSLGKRQNALEVYKDGHAEVQKVKRTANAVINKEYFEENQGLTYTKTFKSHPIIELENTAKIRSVSVGSTSQEVIFYKTNLHAGSKDQYSTFTTFNGVEVPSGVASNELHSGILTDTNFRCIATVKVLAVSADYSDLLGDMEVSSTSFTVTHRQILKSETTTDDSNLKTDFDWVYLAGGVMDPTFGISPAYSVEVLDAYIEIPMIDENGSPYSEPITLTAFDPSSSIEFFIKLRTDRDLTAGTAVQYIEELYVVTDGQTLTGAGNLAVDTLDSTATYYLMASKTSEGANMTAKFDLIDSELALQYNADSKFKAQSGAAVSDALNQFMSISETEPTNKNTKIWVDPSQAVAEYVVEVGVKDGWRFRRYNTGFTEYWRRETRSDLPISTPWGTIYDAGARYITADYPVPFSEIWNAQVSLSETNCEVIIGYSGKNNPLTQPPPIYGVRATSGVVPAVTLNYYASGYIDTNFEGTVLAYGSTT